MNYNGATITEKTQSELYEALEAHKFDLEITRGVSALDQEILDHRIEAVQRLLEWASQAPALEPAVFLAVQTPPPSSSQPDLTQIPVPSLDRLRTSDGWVIH